MAIAALWKPPLLAAMWPAPAWLLQPRPVQHAMSSSIDTSGHSSSSSEESGSSSGGISSSESSESESSRSESSECLQGSLPDAVAEEQLRWDQGQSRVDGASMFDALDKVFMEGGSSSRRLALEHLKAPHHAVAAANADAFGVAVQAAVARSKVPTKVAAAAAAAMSAAAAVPPRRRQQPAAGDDADDVAVVGGKRFQRLPAQAGINVWVCQKVATRATSATGAGSVAAGAAGLSAAASSGAAGKAQGPDHQQPATSAAAVTPALPAMHDQQVLAFVCHLRASDQLLLLTNLHSKGAVAQLQRHPALALLQSQGSRLAGVLHMAAPGVAGSSALRQLCHQLQPAVAAGPAAGQQLLLEQAGAHAGAQVCGCALQAVCLPRSCPPARGGVLCVLMPPFTNTQVIGHLAAARTNAKLHVVSSRIFPLPAGIQAPRAAQPPPASATPQSCASSGSGCGAADPGVQPSSAEHDGQQGQEQEESVGLVAEQLAADCHQAMAAGAVAVSSSASGVVSIRHVSLVTWKQRPPEEQPQPRQLASSGAAATGACPGGGAVSQQQQPRAAAVLVVEPGEGFADDAWCAASAVQQGRPLLVAALERLQEQQQRGLLPSRELSAAGAATWQCRQNLVGPPPPPPLPPTTAGPAQQPIAWPAGVAPQQPGAPPQQQQPTIMRPLYQHAPAAPHQPLLTQPMHLQPAPSPPGQLQSYRQPALAARSDRQQPVHHCSPPQLHPPPPRPPELPDAGGGLAANKRAADSIRARLQGGKRPRAPEGGGDGGSSAAGPQQPQQSLPPEEPRWLRGAPASICQLASGGAAGCAPEVVFLGTGSAEPSKYRGASAIQLRQAASLPPACRPASRLLIAARSSRSRRCRRLRASMMTALLPARPRPLQAAVRAEPAAGLWGGGAGGAAPRPRRRRRDAPGGQPGLPVGVAQACRCVGPSCAATRCSKHWSGPARYPLLATRCACSLPARLPATCPQTTCRAWRRCWRPTPPRCRRCWWWGRARCATGWRRRRRRFGWRGGTALCTARSSTGQVARHRCHACLSACLCPPARHLAFHDLMPGHDLRREPCQRSRTGGLVAGRADHWARQALRRHLGITHLQCVPVRHCSGAHRLAAAA